MKVDIEKKYRTRSGHTVRILTTDRSGNVPVIALVQVPNSSEEIIRTYTLEGIYIKGTEHEYDLVEVSPYEDFKLDEPVLVCNNKNSFSTEEKRHFAGVDSLGKPLTFPNGYTSWTTKRDELVAWNYCRRPTEPYDEY